MEVVLLYVALAVVLIGSVVAIVAGFRIKTRFCPYCSLIIPPQATICPQCHKDL
jgi:hypothetical protein